MLPLLGALLACSDSAAPTPVRLPVLQHIRAFHFPVYVTAPPADTGRIFVVERTGIIRILQHDVPVTTPFLDLSATIPSTAELGMFSMAFHPHYATNGRFYVFFTDVNSDLRIVRYAVSTNPNVADETSADTVLKVVHGGENHHGGQLQFGPDGKLYIGIGDGGCCGDPNGNGQNKHTLLGKILRLDVDGGTGYTIPTDNPFAQDASAEPEIWAYGLRNPWRFSFDKETGDLYIADVGQDLYEEIDIGAKGANYGWRIMEGRHCFDSPCSTNGLVLPILEYQHSDGGCSVTGGYVYRGTRVTRLIGHYLYADYCSGFVRSFRYAGGSATEPTEWTTQISPGGAIVSFGEDAKGDVYIMTYGGDLYRIIAGGIL